MSDLNHTLVAMVISPDCHGYGGSWDRGCAEAEADERVEQQAYT